MRFAVLMRKQFVNNPWITYRWVPQEVLPDFSESSPEAGKPKDRIIGHFLSRDEQGESWQFSGYELNLFPDEAEGYYLNVSSPNSCWFVMWRLEEDIERYVEAQSFELAKTEVSFAVPHRICVSYNEAARLSDGGETVDTVPMSDEHASWLQDYVNEHYRPEPKKRHRPESFKGANRPAEE